MILKKQRRDFGEKIVKKILDAEWNKYLETGQLPEVKKRVLSDDAVKLAQF